MADQADKVIYYFNTEHPDAQRDARIPGVPTSDLTQADIDRLTPSQQRAVQQQVDTHGLYRKTRPRPAAAPEDAKAEAKAPAPKEG